MFCFFSFVSTCFEISKVKHEVGTGFVLYIVLKNELLQYQFSVLPTRPCSEEKAEIMTVSFVI